MFPAILVPMLAGAAVGAATNKKPLQGALIGGAGGALTGGLGGLGGAAASGAGGAASGAAGGAAGLSVPAGMSIAGAMPAAGASSSLGAASSLAPAAGPQLGGLLGSNPWETLGSAANTAAQMGMFQDAPQAPAASAGIPARPADFTGLLSQRPKVSGAQLLMAQRQARRGR